MKKTIFLIFLTGMLCLSVSLIDKNDSVLPLPTQYDIKKAAATDTSGLFLNFHYASDDTIIQPLFVMDSGVGQQPVFLDQHDDFLPYDAFYLYASGPGVNTNGSVRVTAWIMETVEYQDDKNRTVTESTWTDKVFDHVITLRRGMNPQGYGPYCMVAVGRSMGFGDVRPEREMVIVSYLNLNITFFHQTSKWLLPQTKTLGDVAMENLGYIALTTVILGLLGGFGGRWFLNRAGYVPRIGITAILLVIISAVLVFVLWYLIERPTSYAVFWNFLLLPPLFFIMPIGGFSAIFFSSQYRQSLKETLIFKQPDQPMPEDKKEKEWSAENYKQYMKTVIDFKFHVLCSYITDDGKEWFISEKRKNSWYDAVRRFIRGRGIIFELDKMRSTIKCTGGKFDKNPPPTQKIYDRVIPAWDFDYKQGGLPWGTKSVLGNWPLIGILGTWIFWLVGLLTLPIFGYDPSILLTICLVATGLCFSTFLWDRRPTLTDDKMTINPVDRRTAVDVLWDQRGVRIAQFETEDMRRELVAERVDGERRITEALKEVVFMSFDDSYIVKEPAEPHEKPLDEKQMKELLARVQDVFRKQGSKPAETKGGD